MKVKNKTRYRQILEHLESEMDSMQQRGRIVGKSWRGIKEARQKVRKAARTIYKREKEKTE